MESHVPNGRFQTTQWTRIIGSDDTSTDSATEALTALCEAYHYPVFAFIRSRCGDVEKAKDLTQSFFEQLIEKRFYRSADPKLGRFRTFLLGAVKKHMSQDYRRTITEKRGGQQVHLSLDLMQSEENRTNELATDTPSDAVFDHEWAAAVFDQVWQTLEEESKAADEEERFQILRICLTDPESALPYHEIAQQLKTTEGAVKVAVFRLKGRFRDLFRKAVAQIVDNPAHIDEEIRYLIEASSQDPYQSFVTSDFKREK